MKKNLPVTQIEEQYSSALNILSTTDTKGRMTYVNQDFVDVSGFAVSELLGQSHNMVRHPDMPQAAFSSLWETVKSGHSWMGIVKNRCKNGNHYWVDAYVTPVERDGEIAEYQSVRRKPAPDIVARADKVYADLTQGKSPQSLKSGVSLTTKIFCCMLVPALLAALTVMLWSMGATGALISFVVATLVSCIGAYMATKPYRRLVEKARKTAHNPVSRYIYTGRNDDIGQIEFALKMFESETAGLIGRIADSAISLTHGVSGLSSTVTQAEACARQQFAETDQVAAAVHEMSASIQEVAGNAQSSSVSASAGLNEVIKGKEVVQSNVAAIEQLMQEMSLASTVISQVETSSDSISKILDVIGDIADQTNLLALNAAIEAARAGERGRGFSVVAEEVRTLASKTQTSTGEIRQMIEQLQGLTGQAVNVMKSGLEYTECCVQQSGLTAVSLNSILDAIQSINDMNTQIASAVEQQSMVADEISRSIYTIRDMSEQNLAVAETSSGTSQNMLQVSDAFKELSTQFWSKKGI